MRLKQLTHIQWITAVLLLASVQLKAQDTIRVFQYNLLRYGESSQPPASKNPLLKTIIDYTRPDIFGANEIATNSSYHTNILNNVLNTGGVTKWKKGEYSTTGVDKSLSNGLFYNSEKFQLLSQKAVSTVQREITAFRLYYVDSNLVKTQDTIFLTVIVAHLKAGSESSNATVRANETQQVANYLNSLPMSNVIFMGDLNIYKSSETAYQNLVNNPNLSGRMYDPIDKPGYWNDNAAFADIHTQSTHTTQSGGFSSGGMDDRFDIMLCSQALMGDSLRMRVLPETYKAIGNDGQHLNKALTDPPTNTTVPSGVIGALYNMSDHIPICADFVVTPMVPVATGIDQQKRSLEQMIRVSNPVERDGQIFFHPQLKGKQFSLRILNTEGKLVSAEKMLQADGTYSYHFDESWSKGLYVICLTDESGITVSKKIIKR